MRYDADIVFDSIKGNLLLKSSSETFFKMRSYSES